MLVVLVVFGGYRPASAGEPQSLPLEPLAIRTESGVIQLQVQVARSYAEQMKGLMFRKSLPDGEGMLFVFGSPQYASFWMRDTYIPLDLLYIAQDGEIVQIDRERVPLSDEATFSETEVSAVLEINGGLSEAWGIEPGDKVRHPEFDKYNGPAAWEP